jgi:hypothetical protein
MKKIFLLLILSLNVSCGMDYGKMENTENANVLKLEKFTSQSGGNYIIHFEKTPLTQAHVVFMGEEVSKLKDQLFKLRSKRFFCDGSFSFFEDYRGNSFIALSSVTVCIDEDGKVIAKNIGKKTPDDEINRKIEKLNQILEEEKN